MTAEYFLGKEDLNEAVKDWLKKKASVEWYQIKRVNWISPGDDFLATVLVDPTAKEPPDL